MTTESVSASRATTLWPFLFALLYLHLKNFSSVIRLDGFVHVATRKRVVKECADTGEEKMRFPLLVCLFALLVCSCKTTPSPNNPPQPPTPNNPQSANPVATTASPAANTIVVTKPKIDACALLSKEEIEAIQGEAVKETKLSGQAVGGYTISQCFFSLPTFTNSISLMVAHRGDTPGAKDPKEFWRETFHDEEAREKDKEGEREEEEKESAPPEKVRGVGKEAFWMGNKISGALYVLKGDAYIRVSIGGPMDAATKKRAKALAEKAIARL